MSEELKAAIVGAVVGSMSAGWLSYFISKAGIKATHRNALALLQQQEFSNASLRDFLITSVAVFGTCHPTCAFILNDESL